MVDDRKVKGFIIGHPILYCPRCKKDVPHSPDHILCVGCGLTTYSDEAYDEHVKQFSSIKSDSVRTCQKCSGSGRVEDVCNHLAFTKECELCDGVGKIPTESDSKRMVEK